jgi:hypothetical protein
MFILCIGYVSCVVLPCIPLHSVIVDIGDNVHPVLPYYRIYGNLMRTSIFKTLKPKKYLLANVMGIGKKCSLYNNEFLLRI